MSLHSLTLGKLSRLAAPIILANLASPLLGLVDTAVIGHLGDATLLAALALATMIFNFIFWGFGFLRMGTTALVAQARGRSDLRAANDILGRSLLLAVALGGLLWLIQIPLQLLVFHLTGASEAVERSASTYYEIRIWGAPVHLMLLGVMGYLLGQQRTGEVLALQIFLNSSNIVLDLIFVVGLDYGVGGVAAGTVSAELITLIVAYRWLTAASRRDGEGLVIERLFNFVAIKKLIAVNRDIMIRTLSIIFAFAWFTDRGARLGDDYLAANLLLMQFVAFSAFFIDGFAIASESLMGEAHGRAKRSEVTAIIRSAFVAGLGIATLLTLCFVFIQAPTLNALTSNQTIVDLANDYALWMLLTPLISFAAYIYDGLFIGATKTRAMRNAMLVSLLIYLLAWFFTQNLYNHGLWLALMIYYVARAGSLAYHHNELYQFNQR